MKKSLLAMLLALSFTMICNAQPTYHDEYQNILIKVGYGYLNHDKIVESSYNTISFEAEVLYSFIGSKVNLKAGRDYKSFSPFGVLMFLPAIVVRTIGDLDPSSVGMFMLFALSAAQIHIPITDYVEITGGWDAFKFTKLRNIDNDTFYCTGELNAGFNVFFNDNFFLSALYEYNHTHNGFIKSWNWLNEPIHQTINYQPTWLNGHAFSIRLGYLF